MPFKIKTESSLSPAPAPVPAQAEAQPPRRRRGRPKKNAGPNPAPAKQLAPPREFAPDFVVATTRSRSQLAAKTTLAAQDLVHQSAVLGHSDDVSLGKPYKRARTEHEQFVRDSPDSRQPASPPTDLADVARGLHALAESLEEEQSQKTRETSLSSGSTTIDLHDVQVKFEALVAELVRDAPSQSELLQPSANFTTESSWTPGRRIDTTTLGSAIKHLESFGLTAAELRSAFQAQRSVSTGFALMGALVRYMPELRKLGLTPPEIMRLCTKNAAPLGRVVGALDVWKKAHLDMTRLIAIAMHDGPAQTLTAMVKHLSDFLNAGGKIDILLDAYYRGSAPEVFAAMVGNQQDAARKIARVRARLAANESIDDALMLQQLTSPSGQRPRGVTRPVPNPTTIDAAQTIASQISHEMSAYGGPARHLQQIGMADHVIVYLSRRSSIASPLTHVQQYTSELLRYHVSMQLIEKLAMHDLSLETLRQFALHAPRLLQRGMTPAQIAAFVTTTYHSL